MRVTAETMYNDRVKWAENNRIKRINQTIDPGFTPEGRDLLLNPTIYIRCKAGLILLVKALIG